MSNWTFNIQRAISHTLLVEVGYVGSKVTHLYWNRQHNQNDPADTEYGSALTSLVAESLLRYDHHGSGKHAKRSPSAQALRPYPQYGDVLIFRDPYGDQNYESMTVKVQKQARTGFHVHSGVHALEDHRQHSPVQHLGGGTLERAYNANYNRSVEANDVPQRLVLSYIYEVPFGKGGGTLRRASALMSWEDGRSVESRYSKAAALS